VSGFSSKTIDIDGKKVRYFTNGRKGKDTLLLLHGFMSDASSLVPLAQHLQADQPIIIPDLPGFGESEALDSTEGLQAYVDWCRRFLQVMKIEAPSSIVGYSFGAYIAVLYASLFPQSPETKLILLTPVVKLNWKVRLYGRGFHFASIKARKTAERVYLLQYDMTTRYLRKAKHPSVKNELMERRREELSYLNSDLILRLVSEFLEFDMFAYADRIKVPTIIVTASNDNVAAAGATRHFAGLIKEPIIMVEILHAGHLLPIEEPVLLATTLKNYLLEAPGLSTGPRKPGRKSADAAK
jgi:pimeloyl-ACP methyl ester carboxylesterase